MRLEDKKRLALVLSGGGVKAAAFHIGVCLALQQKGFRFAGGPPELVNSKYKDDKKTFKIYVGSSAGAVITTFLAAGRSLEDLIDAFEMGSKVPSGLRRLTSRLMNKAPVEKPRLKPITYRNMFSLNSTNIVRLFPGLLRRRSIVTVGGLEALIKHGFKVNGIFTTAGLERYIRKHVLAQNSFDSLGVKLFVVATQLNHSRKVIFGDFAETTKDASIKYANFSTISDAVAASASLPPVFAPYGITDNKGKMIHYFDGEIRDTLSTHVAADHGADLVIASYSVQPYHYTERMGSLHNYGIPMIMNQALYQVVQQKINKHIEHQQDIAYIINAVDGYFRQAKLPEEHRERLVKIITERVNYRPNVDYMYIHPNSNNCEMFFADHFSLNREILKGIVKVGFKSALDTLRKHNL